MVYRVWQDTADEARPHREPHLWEVGMQRIVVAVDMSEPSLRAVDLAADLAAKYDAELVLLTIGREMRAQIQAWRLMRGWSTSRTAYL